MELLTERVLAENLKELDDVAQTNPRGAVLSLVAEGFPFVFVVAEIQPDGTPRVTIDTNADEEFNATAAWLLRKAAESFEK